MKPKQKGGRGRPTSGSGGGQESSGGNTGEAIVLNMEPVLQELRNIKSDFAELLKSVSNATDCQKDYSTRILDILNTKLSDMEQKITTLENKQSAIQMENYQLREKLIKIESQSRRDNLLMDGIPESAGETWDDCREKVYKILEDKMKIDNARGIMISRCHRLGPKRAEGARPRTIIFKLHWYGDREKIWSSKSNLKDTNVFLSEDYPAEIQQRRKKLFPILKAARQQRMKASLSVDKLMINDREYTVNTLHSLPPELHPDKVANRKVDST